MSKKIFYIAGPMTGLPEYNYPAFEAVAGVLREAGHHVISPHEVDNGDNGIPGSVPYKTYIKNGLIALLECNAIVLLNGWNASKGARIEEYVASRLGYASYRYIEGLFYPRDAKTRTLLEAVPVGQL